MPQIIYSGASVAYWTGFLTPITNQVLKNYYPNQSEQFYLKYCCFSLMFFGFGSVVSSIVMGYIIDCTSSKKAIVFNLVCLAFTLVVQVNNIWNNDYKFAILATFTWGFQDGAIKTHSFQMLANEFDSQNDPFSIFLFVQGFSCGIFQIIQALIDDDNADQKSYYTYSVLVYGLLAVSITSCFQFK